MNAFRRTKPTNTKIVFDHFIACDPTTWKRARQKGKRFFLEHGQVRAMGNLGWEVKAHEPQLRLDYTARFGIVLKVYLRASRGGDGDNYLKLLLDALTDIVWANDEQVDEIMMTKEYSRTEPGLRLTIYVIHQEN